MRCNVFEKNIRCHERYIAGVLSVLQKALAVINDIVKVSRVCVAECESVL